MQGSWKKMSTNEKKLSFPVNTVEIAVWTSQVYLHKAGIIIIHKYQFSHIKNYSSTKLLQQVSKYYVDFYDDGKNISLNHVSWCYKKYKNSAVHFNLLTGKAVN